MSPVVRLGAEEAGSAFTETSSLFVCSGDFLIIMNAAAVGLCCLR